MEPALWAGDWIVVAGYSRPPRVGAVADGACTVLGDRPEESTDSRTFGPVPLGNVVGRALFRYAPIGRIGWLW